MSYHIRDVLRSVQEAAPAPRTTTDDIIAKAGRIRARRSAVLVAGGVVAITTAIVAGLGTTSAPDGQQAAAQPASSPVLPAVPAPSASAPPPVLDGPPMQPAGFTTRLTEYRVGDYRIGPAGQVAPGYQQIPVYQDKTWPGDDGTKYPLAEGQITVYAKGVYDPGTFNVNGNETTVLGPEYKLKVAGRAAVGRDWTYLSPVDREAKWVRAALAWQYAPDSWATFMPDYAAADLPRADVAKIAAELGTDGERELLVPYRIGFLPAGWRPVAVTQTPGATSSVVSKVFLHKGPLTESAARPIDEVFPHSAMITVSRSDPKDDTLTGDGLKCYDGRASCVVLKGDYLIQVEDWNSVLTPAEVRRITEGLQLRDLRNQKTWVPLGN